MRLLRLDLTGHRSVECLTFDADPFTVLFGKNNAGKTNILEALYGVLAPGDDNAIRKTYVDRGSNPLGAIHVELEPGLPFDDKILAVIPSDMPGADSRRVAFTDSGLVVGGLDDYFYAGPEFIDPSRVVEDPKRRRIAYPVSQLAVCRPARASGGRDRETCEHRTPADARRLAVARDGPHD
ncbi:AAA family ATPase [Rhodococcus hoagii]|nr:AAA family ATPase [Prescottella equi]